MNNRTFEKYIGFVKIIDRAQWNKNEMKGFVELDKFVYEKLIEFERIGYISPIIWLDNKTMQLDDVDSKVYGKKILVELTPPKNPTGKAYFAYDIYQLLENKSFLFTEPELYYVLSEDFLNTKSSPTSTIMKYKSIIQLIQLLTEICDHSSQNGDNLELVYLTNKKLTISISYNIDNMPILLGIIILNDKINQEPHRENKRQIFKSILCESLINIPPQERFLHLTNNFDLYLQRFDDDYNLFTSEISVEKLKEEVTEKKVKFMDMLNNVIAEIQNKILTIPVALLLISTQLENKPNTYFKNTAILFSSYIFYLLINILVNNQRSTLKSIKTAFKKSELQFKTSYASLFDKFVDEFKDLMIRYKYQKKILIIIDSLALTSVILCLILYVLYSGIVFNL